MIVPDSEKIPDKPKLNIALRVIRVVLGFSVLLVGIALIVLPGPAIVVIPMGLAILATEYAWAKRYLQRFQDGGKKIIHIFRSNKKENQKP